MLCFIVYSWTEADIKTFSGLHFRIWTNGIWKNIYNDGQAREPWGKRTDSSMFGANISNEAVSSITGLEVWVAGNKSPRDLEIDSVHSDSVMCLYDRCLCWKYTTKQLEISCQQTRKLWEQTMAFLLRSMQSNMMLVGTHMLWNLLLLMLEAAERFPFS